MQKGRCRGIHRQTEINRADRFQKSRDFHSAVAFMLKFDYFSPFFFHPSAFSSPPLNRHKGLHWVSAVIYFKTMFLIKCAPKGCTVVLHLCAPQRQERQRRAADGSIKLSYYYDGTGTVGGILRNCKMKIRPIESNNYFNCS